MTTMELNAELFDSMGAENGVFPEEYAGAYIECGTFSPAQYYCRGRIVDAEGRESRYAPRQTERDGRNRVYRQRGNPERD